MIFQKLNVSLYKKIVLVFLAVVTPIFIMGIYIRNWGAETVRNELTKSTRTQIEFYLGQLEKEIERLKILQYACLADENLNQLALQYDILTPYSITRNINQLQARLMAIEFSSNYVKNVNAHLFSIQKTISSSRGSLALDTSVFERMQAASETTGAQIIRYQNGLYLATVYPLSAKSPNSNFVIEIELNQDALQNDLEQFGMDLNSGAFLLDLTNYNEIAAINGGKALKIEDILIAQEAIYQNRTGRYVLDDNRYYYVYVKSEYLDLLLLRYLPEHIVFAPLQNFTKWVWLFILVSTVAILIFTISMNRFINKPIKKLVQGFRQVEKGDFSVNVDPTEVKSTEFAYLFMRFNKMIERLNTLIDQVYKQKILMQRAELKQLQAQIKPHFLYNSFFTISTMAELGDENIVEFTNYLGEYYRYLTRNAADTLPLSEEVRHARTYTHMQTMRFSKNLTVEFEECPQDYEIFFVPRLILQPIIENAFEHAVEKRVYNRKIRVSFFEKNGRLCISVEDNGAAMTSETRNALALMLQDDSENIETTALINIHRRLKLYYGDDSGIELRQSALGGLCVTLVLGGK